MFKRLAMILSLFAYLMFSVTETVSIHANEPLGDEDWSPKVVYLDLDGCTDCGAVKTHGVITGLIAQGIDVVIYDVMDAPFMSTAYASTYQVPGGKAAPIIFAGSQYFQGSEEIIEAYDSGLIASLANEPLLDVSDYVPRDYGFWGGLIFVIFAGLLDGVNPCAIAMLLMFISMVGFTKDRRILLTVAISYIGAIFITYIGIGFGFLTILGLSRTAFANFAYFLYGGFAILCLFLFIITFYDFIVTRKEQYGKVKNQLPKFIQGFNKRIMKKFTDAINDEEGGIKQALLIVFVPVFLGIIVGVVEAACTGQIYIGVLAWVESRNPGGGISTLEIFYMIVFNIMFVVPLIIIALIAVKARSVVGVANYIREHLSVIKLLTAIFFLMMATYFIIMVFNPDLLDINFEFLLGG